MSLREASHMNASTVDQVTQAGIASAVQRRKVKAALISIISNSSLVVAKLVVGLLIGSISVISEAIHSGVDLVAAIIAFFAVRFSGAPADEKHPYGHGKMENLSGLAEALLIFLAAGWIIYEAVHKLSAPQAIEAPGWGIVIMAVSAVANFVVSENLFRVGRETESMALEADAWHLRTDVYTSAGVMFGLLAVWVGQHIWPGTNLAWVDPVSAILVALLIIKAAWELSVEAAAELLDAGLPEEEGKQIRAVLEAHRPRILGYHDLRTRRSGGTRLVDVHIVVEPDMTVVDSHTLAMAVSHDIQQKFSRASVTTHIEPCFACTERCLSGCLLAPDQRKNARQQPAACSSP